MTLRNVPNSFTLEQQRLEINELAVDLDTAVDGIQTFSGNKTFSDSVVFNTDIRLDDDASINFGTSIDASLRYQTSTSSLRLFANNTDVNLFADNFNFYTSVSDDALKIIQNGGVELYYDNVKTLETTSTGVTATGTIIADGLSVSDNENIDIGDDADLRLYHNATDSYIKERGTGNLYIDSTAGSVNIRVNDTEDAVVATQDGSVALYHNGVLKAETATSGLRVNNYLYSSGNLTIVSGGTILSRSHMILPNSTTSAFEINGSTSGAGGITINSGLGSVRLQHNGATKLSTTSSGVSITGTASATEFSGALTGNADTATALETARNIAGQSFDGTANITIAATDLSDTDQALATTSDVTFNSITKSGGLSTEFLKADGTVDSSTYLTSYTETDPVVAAINGIVKSDGTTISAAVAGTDYVASVGSESYTKFGTSTSPNPGIASTTVGNYILNEAQTSDIETSFTMTSGYTKALITLNAMIWNVTDGTTEALVEIERSVAGGAYSKIGTFIFPVANTFYGAMNFTLLDTHGATAGDTVSYKLKNGNSVANGYSDESIRLVTGTCGDTFGVREIA